MAAKTLPDQEYLRQLFSYDRSTGLVFWRERPQNHFDREYEFKRWNSRYAGILAGNVNRLTVRPHWTVMIDAKTYPLHRVIWKLETNEDPPEVDHQDRNSMNNCWDNLRAATHVQNCSNRIRRSNSDLPTGVRRSGRKFFAHIGSKGKRFYLGTFDTIEAASAAYRQAAIRLHEEFAINHPSRSARP